MIHYVKRFETSIMLLEEGLERVGGDADKFVALFDAIAVSSPSEEYKDALDKFFNDKAETIKKLPFSTEQIRRMSNYINKSSIGIMFLEGGLERSGGDADKFFRAFKDAAVFFPTVEYRKALDKFFYDNAEEIKKMPFSTKQIRYMSKYVGEASTRMMFLEMALERSGGDADKFFRAFKNATVFFPSEEYREALRKLFLEKIETISSLGLSTRQIRYMNRYINAPSFSAKIFEDSLKKNKGKCAAGVMVLFSSGLNFGANAESDVLLHE